MTVFQAAWWHWARTVTVFPVAVNLASQDHRGLTPCSAGSAAGSVETLPSFVDETAYSVSSPIYFVRLEQYFAAFAS